ncbi:MAG TPA: universal stress protein [Acidobacteriota bacterium]
MQGGTTYLDLKTAVLLGTPAREISDFAAEKNADLVIVGTHAHLRAFVASWLIFHAL